MVASHISGFNNLNHNNMSLYSCCRSFVVGNPMVLILEPIYGDISIALNKCCKVTCHKSG